MSRSALTRIGLAAAFISMTSCNRQSPASISPTAAAEGRLAASADGSTLKATAPVPVSPVNNAQVSDPPTLTATASALRFLSGTPQLQYRFEVFGESGLKAEDSGLVASPSFKPTAALEFGKRHTWRVRAEYQGMVGPWSTVASFVAPEGGYIRGNEAFDPLTNGKTVGDRIGQTTFIPGKGIRLENSTSYVRYLLPQTLSRGEFSMEVEGLRANAPGNKSKVFGMQEGQDDFITNRYRVDVQYRGTTGTPPNAITFRALYGSADDLDVRYEPDTGTRFASVFDLNPATTYYWQATWGSEFRVIVKEGGMTGRTIYNVGMSTPDGSYEPSPHYLYLGAPTGRSGEEAASIPGTIYRNVFIGLSRPPR